ncbi:MAG: tRNA (cytidine(34)-2'-O)-methyltransferase [Fimbriiglobus sp.]
MMHIALWEPEIPPNTGNIARLCAATDAHLHLIGRLGFRIDEKTVRRAGCDYWPHVKLQTHVTFEDFLQVVPVDKIWVIENPATRSYTEIRFTTGDCLLFGNEGHGLPASILDRFQDRLASIPMMSEHVRSLNLANAVSIVLYEALRQLHDW